MVAGMSYPFPIYPPQPPFHHHPQQVPLANPPPGLPHPILPIDPRYPHFQHPQPSGVYLQDSNGWFFSPPSGYGPFPSPIRQSPPPPPPPQTLPEADNQPKIHDYWKGRIIAPLAGPSVPHGPVTLTTHQPVAILKPAQKAPRAENSLLLLPPRSYGQNGANPPSPDAQPKEREDDTSQSFRFDRYADVFVPQWLKDIQNQDHRLQPLPPRPTFPHPSYLRTFLVPSLIEQLCVSPSTTLLSSPPPTSSPPPLTIETYDAHWTALLAWELDALTRDKENTVLWKMGIQIENWARAEFLLFAAGIRENYPRLDIGDLVHMREVLDETQNGSGNAFEGRVIALRKREGFIHLMCPALKTHIQQYVRPTHSKDTHEGLFVFTPDDVLPLLFNITFLMNARPSFVMQAAASTVVDALFGTKSFVNNLFGKSYLDNSLGARWLFPEPKDMESEFSSRSYAISPTEWVDSGLNEEQRSAVCSIALHQSLVPYIISGPPGTGKTRTLVETVIQILRVQPEACILLCAPSNPATDTLVLRLRDHLQPHEMFRLNDHNRTFAEVPVQITQFCYIEDDSFGLPPWETLMRYRVVVCSCLDASILVTAQCTNSSLARMENDLMSALHRHRKQPIMPHWTHLLIDEAGQGSEPELLIPISVVINPLRGETPPTGTSEPVFEPQLVLCGDPNQLGPIVISEAARTAELDISLLERLFERPLYAAHGEARSRMHKGSPTGSTPSMAPFTNLVKNYRSHPAILMPPSAIFYNDSLQPCAQNGTISWSRLPNPRLPLVFMGSDSEEQSVDERASWYNEGESDRVANTITSLILEGHTCSPPLRAVDIGVMAPWRGQVWKIREKLRTLGLSAVDVGTVEDYQGRERRVVLISCVRSRSRFLKEDAKKGLGLVFERKRMNVAITRAKELLVVIGNGALLQRDPYWKSFLQFALRNKLYIGPTLDLELDGNYISRLESEYFNARETDVDLAEEHGRMVAGGMAREILKD